MADTNVVAIAGSAVTFNCSSSGRSNVSGGRSTPIRWQYTSYGRSTPVGVYNGRTINVRFRPHFRQRFDMTTSSSLLTISDVRFSDAGTYSCSKLQSSSKISIHCLSVGTIRNHTMYLKCAQKLTGCHERLSLPHSIKQKLNEQEVSYRKQITRQLRSQYVKGIYRFNCPVTLKSKLAVTQGH